MGPWRCLLLLPLLAVALRAQQQQFMEYVERRLTLLEVGTHAGPTSARRGAPGAFLPGGGSRPGARRSRAGDRQSWCGVPLLLPGPPQPSTSLAGTGA